MAESCRLTCDVCVRTCEDLSERCRDWVQQCEERPLFMARHCARTCNTLPSECRPQCQIRTTRGGCPGFGVSRHLLTPDHARAIRGALHLTNSSALPAFNPSVVDDLVFYNVNFWASRTPGFSSLINQSSVIGVDRTGIRYTIRGAEDLRLVRVNGTRLLGLFSRYRRRRQKEMYLTSFRPRWERRIVLEKGIAPPKKTSEGNWMPFAHNGTLFASYFLCPHTIVHIDTRTAHATKMYETRHPSCASVSSPGNPLRGGTAGVEIGSRYMLGLAHYKKFGAYTHALYRRSLTPPFELQNVSRKFRFPGARLQRVNKSFLSHVQFSLSMSLRNRTFFFHYGVSDRSAHVVTLSWDGYCAFTKWCGGVDSS